MTDSQSLLGQARTLGGVGALLLLLTFAPYVGVVLGIAGLALILVAVSRIGTAVGDPSISRNALIAVLLAIAGVLVGGLVLFAAVFRMMGLGYLAGPDFNPFTAPTDFWGLVAAMLVALVIMWAFYVASAVFLKRSSDAIAARLNVGMFRTAALLYLIGAALAILVIGFALIFVAEILFVVAFFSIPEDTPRAAGVPA